MSELAKKVDESDINAAYLSADDLKLAASLLYQSYHDDPIFL